uniref:Uncharacterized protein n=1 Tax=Tanacetum cinerariifolium TaxID=118510 RepID=A0A699HB23_TANCI|nr:hypothetical protein [Tanacetum cinerariifolium]
MDLFSLISAPNPAKVKIKTRPRAAHEVPLLTAIASCVIDMKDMTGRDILRDTGISLVGNPPYTEVMPEPDLKKQTVAMGALVNKRRRKRGSNEAEANAPPKVLRKDHVASHLSQSTLGGKSLVAIGIGTGSTVSAPTTQETPVHAEGVSDLDPLSYAKLPPAPEQDIAQSSRKAVVRKIMTLRSLPHSPPWVLFRVAPLPNDEFLNQYNTTLARQVAMGSQLRLRLKQETKLLKKAVARQDQRIQAREKYIKNLEALLEAEADMKDIAKAKNMELVKELESIHVQFSDLQVSNHQLSQQVSTPQAQVTCEERIKDAFEEFKKYEDDRVSS